MHVTFHPASDTANLEDSCTILANTLVYLMGKKNLVVPTTNWLLYKYNHFSIGLEIKNCSVLFVWTLNYSILMRKRGKKVQCSCIMLMFTYLECFPSCFWCLLDALKLFSVQKLLAHVNKHLFNSINLEYPPILDPRLEALAAGDFDVQLKRLSIWISVIYSPYRSSFITIILWTCRFLCFVKILRCQHENFPIKSSDF